MKKTLQFAGAAATIDTIGAELISYRDASGTERIWTGDERYWSGHSPVLFPIVGALKDGKTKIDGVEYAIKKHGFARRSAFSVISEKADSIRLALQESAETLAVFPFPFTLTVTHTLVADGFRTEYAIKNTGTREMFCGVGGHAGFCCPMESGVSFEDYVLRFECVENLPAAYTDENTLTRPDLTKSLLENTDTLPLRYRDFDDDALLFTGLKSKEVSLVNQKSGRGVSFSFGDFKTLAVWTPPQKNAPFVCLEPWMSGPDSFDASGEFTDKPDLLKIAPGAEKALGYTVKLV